MKKINALILLLMLVVTAKADEGMWMLPLIEKLNIQKMNGMGCTLTADEIYSDKNVSLKDAVIVFGNGCTGVVVSNQGLVFTNHHCGYSAIQQHSSVEHNYLKDGFTAQKPEDEIPTPGLTVKFLVSITDVTERVISQLPDELKGEARASKQDSILRVIKKETEKGNKYVVQVKPFFSGNEFYTFVFEEFKDIRFVYAPPSSIGKFGGDTDNWMWPRHTGDFSVFRVYSDKDGKPAAYAKDNVPYTPKRFAAISNKGYNTGDFAMIMGNPGSTDRYLSSWGIENRMKATNQARIDVRGAKQAVWLSFMKADEAINIAYASKFARSSNYWKNSIGMNNAIAKLGVLDRKRSEEKEFAKWIAQTPDRKARYAGVLNALEEGYTKLQPYSLALNYLRESLLSGVELPRMASQLEKIARYTTNKDSILVKAKAIYQDYYPQVDEAALPAMLAAYKKAVKDDALPEVYTTIHKKYKGNFEKYAQYMFDKSAFASYEAFEKAVKKGQTDFSADPALTFWEDVNRTLRNIASKDYDAIIGQITDAERLYEAALLQIAAEKGKPMSPDANSTMRMTYGTISGYKPADAVAYNYYTTTRGILEKEKPGDYEFDVPAKLKQAITDNNYGAYIDTRSGEMHVAFLSNNDITGGNSGSPIFNAKGELLGLAFDGNWEAMSGDIVFEPDLQRTISVDVRYILFIMDKIGGAKRLIDELSIK
jgi:hypothetical protein